MNEMKNLTTCLKDYLFGSYARSCMKHQEQVLTEFELDKKQRAHQVSDLNYACRAYMFRLQVCNIYCAAFGTMAIIHDGMPLWLRISSIGFVEGLRLATHASYAKRRRDFNKVYQRMRSDAQDMGELELMFSEWDEYLNEIRNSDYDYS